MLESVLNKVNHLQQAQTQSYSIPCCKTPCLMKVSLQMILTMKDALIICYIFHPKTEKGFTKMKASFHHLYHRLQLAQ
jgi:hypothetical protein